MHNIFFEIIKALIRDQAFLGLDIGKGSRNEITSPYLCQIVGYERGREKSEEGTRVDMNSFVRRAHRKISKGGC